MKNCFMKQLHWQTQLELFEYLILLLQHILIILNNKLKNIVLNI